MTYRYNRTSIDRNPKLNTLLYVIAISSKTTPNSEYLEAIIDQRNKILTAIFCKSVLQESHVKIKVLLLISVIASRHTIYCFHSWQNQFYNLWLLFIVS